MASTRPTSAPVAPSTTRPDVNGTRSRRNPARPVDDVMKHTSWLSGFTAVGRSIAAATARTSVFVMSPTGSSVIASCGWVSM
jgi:hypothetical protein